MSEQKSQEATGPMIGEILHDMLCAVSIKRCDEYGCAHGVASSMPKEWRCHACAAYDALSALQQRVERLEAVQEAARAVWMEERLVLQAALAHAEQRVEQVTAERYEALDEAAARREAWNGAMEADARANDADQRLAAAEATIANLSEALKAVDMYFRRNQASGNFHGDDEHEAWTAASTALASLVSLSSSPVSPREEER